MGLAAWSPLPARRRYPVLQACSSPNCRIESVWLLVLDLHRSVAAAIRVALPIYLCSNVVVFGVDEVAGTILCV
jgi:hypothetical protein